MATLTETNKLVFASLKRHFSGAYSSGSVQDLHLIPFSLFFRRCGIIAPKSGRKGTQHFSICPL